MTWTYSVADLATSEKDQIRAETGDTDPTDPLLADEEILRAIAVEEGFWSAAARCAEIIARRFLRKADPRLGRSLYVIYSKAAQQYQDMAVMLRKRATGTNLPYVGGMSKAAKRAYQLDTDTIQPAITRRMMENPWVGGYTSDTEGPRGEPPITV